MRIVQSHRLYMKLTLSDFADSLLLRKYFFLIKAVNQLSNIKKKKILEMCPNVLLFYFK